MKKGFGNVIALSLLFLTAAASAASPVHPVKTFKVENYGAVPDGESDAGPAIRAAIAAATAAGGKTEVLLGKGRYRIQSLQGPKFHFILNHTSSFTLRGIPGETELIFSNPDHPAFALSGCRDTLLKDFSFDYDPVPFTQGTVTAVDRANGTFDLELDAGYPLLSAPWFTAEGMGFIFDRTRRRLKSGVPDFAFVVSRTPLQGQRWRLKFRDDLSDRVKALAVGDAYVHLARLPGGTIEMNGCSGGGLDNVTMFASPGLALLLAGSETRITLSRFQVRFKPGSNRLVASNGDGAHCPQNRHGPFLDECYFEGLCDDGVNIYCRPNIIREVRSSTQIVVSGNTKIRAGDLIQFYNPNAGIVRGEVRAAEVQKEGNNLHLTLDAPIRDANSGGTADHVYNLSACGAGFVVRNSTFNNHRRNGLTIRGRDGLIEGNTFDHLCGFAINACNTPSWPEGPIPSNLTIRRNTFIGGSDLSGYGSQNSSASVRVFSLKNSGFTTERFPASITIAENIFRSPPGACIFLGSVKDAKIVDNRTDSAAPFVRQYNCGPVVERNNIRMP